MAYHFKRGIIIAELGFVFIKPLVFSKLIAVYYHRIYDRLAVIRVVRLLGNQLVPNFLGDKDLRAKLEYNIRPKFRFIVRLGPYSVHIYSEIQRPLVIDRVDILVLVGYNRNVIIVLIKRILGRY